jgi:hypothetical protein
MAEGRDPEPPFCTEMKPSSAPAEVRRTGFLAFEAFAWNPG